MLNALVCAFVTALASSSAAGDDVQHNYSLTLSPLHLALPMVEGTGEVRLEDDIGVAGVLGGGRITASGETFTAFEVGAQFRYYVFGSFIHGMMLGAELGYLKVDGNVGAATVAVAGLWAGPFVGYKIATNVGFTFDAQLGAQFNRANASAETTTATAKVDGSSWTPLLNLNVGWSF